MDAGFWRQRWERNQIGFHQSQTNPYLVQFFPALLPAEGSRVFVPLCGKSLDLHWLRRNGYRVAGAELSEIAVRQLFEELGIEPVITPLGKIRRYSAEGMDLFAGDIFDLSHKELGAVDAIYDRAALVALPEALRTRYTAHLMDLSDRAPQLLICFEYDQSRMDGPPFSISAGEAYRHYQDHYDLTQLACVEVPGGLKGKLPAQETVWQLTRRNA